LLPAEQNVGKADVFLVRWKCFISCVLHICSTLYDVSYIGQ